MKMTTRRRLLTAATLSQQGRLPTGFREVEWLQGSGTQYCETSYKAKYINGGAVSVLRGDMTALSVSNTKFSIMTSWVLSSTLYHYGARIMTPQNNAQFQFHYGSTASHSYELYLKNYWTEPVELHYEINADNLILNDLTLPKNNQAFNESTNNILIGGYRLQAGSVIINNENARIKAFALYEATTSNPQGILVSEFIPCYRTSDHKAGFYETGTDLFLPNLGSGSDWIIGPVV